KAMDLKYRFLEVFIRTTRSVNSCSFNLLALENLESKTIGEMYSKKNTPTPKSKFTGNTYFEYLYILESFGLLTSRTLIHFTNILLYIFCSIFKIPQTQI